MMNKSGENSLSISLRNSLIRYAETSRGARAQDWY